jgi:hypothetical protein
MYACNVSREIGFGAWSCGGTAMMLVLQTFVESYSQQVQAVCSSELRMCSRHSPHPASTYQFRFLYSCRGVVASEAVSQHHLSYWACDYSISHVLRV